MKRHASGRGQRRAFMRFMQDDAGSATLEMLVWVPLLVEIALILVDASTAHWRHAEMYTVAYDSVRQVAMGNFDGDVTATKSLDSLVKDYVAGVHGFQAADYDVNYNQAGGYHVLSIATSLDRLSAFGNLTGGMGSLTATVVMLVEP